jgi:hypothetical protein
MPVFFCWHCYGDNPSAVGICRHCGRPIAPPEHTSYTAKLLWALDHPLTERRMVAARVLGARGEHRAVPALQRLVAQKEDPFLAAEALQSLVRIVGARALEGELRRLAESGDAPLRRVARRVLAHLIPCPEEQQGQGEQGRGVGPEGKRQRPGPCKEPAQDYQAHGRASSPAHQGYTNRYVLRRTRCCCVSCGMVK